MGEQQARPRHAETCVKQCGVDPSSTKGSLLMVSLLLSQTNETSHCRTLQDRMHASQLCQFDRDREAQAGGAPLDTISRLCLGVTTKPEVAVWLLR